MSSAPPPPNRIYYKYAFHKFNYNISVIETEARRTTMQKISQSFSELLVSIAMGLSIWHEHIWEACVKSLEKQTCIHLINTVQEVIGGSGYTVTAHAKSAICAFISGVICSTVIEERQKKNEGRVLKQLK